MMSNEDLKAWSQKKWMKGQCVPPLHQWLGQDRSIDSKERLAACGNIVVPPMAFFGLQCLYSMWR